MVRFILLISSMILILFGCDKEENPMEPQPKKMFKITVENISTAKMFSGSGIFNTPVGASNPAPVGPEDAYEFEFKASLGAKLSFASMFVQSNDLLYAPDGMGIMLFNQDGSPLTGDITTQIKFWDTGTEMNEMPGFGLNQAPRQMGPNMGTDESGVVKLVNDEFYYPAVVAVIRVTITTE